uniref:Uncharacterized protein n=1 Tax=Siphoviridae sp. ctwIM10 TaxID=2825728 RepID=A0A8S5U881_9CAUD|nr:MAG TPA: hypothetical protein [Siphoviridae sp. ctwIM10]
MTLASAAILRFDAREEAACKRIRYLFLGFGVSNFLHPSLRAISWHFSNFFHVKFSLFRSVQIWSAAVCGVGKVHSAS